MRIGLVVLILAAAATPATLAAQARPDSAPVLLPSVSVTATRTPLSSTAQAVTVTEFSRTELRDAGIIEIADVLRLVPGATVLSSGSFGSQTSLFLRGGESDYVQVLVDGVPLNAPGGAYDFGHLTLDNIERVEVVRGPASVLYGSDAVTGVIQIFTRRGSGPARLNGLVGGGSYGGRRLELGASGSSGGLGWSLGVVQRETDGVRPFNSQYRNDDVSAAARWAGQRGDIGVSARLTDFEFHYPTNSAGALVDSNAFATEERVIAAVDGGWRVMSNVELRARATSNVAEPKTRDLPNFPGHQTSFVSDAKVTRTGLELRGIATLRSTHILTLSVDRSRDEEESTSLSESEFGPFAGGLSAERTNLGMAAQLHGNLGARNTYTIGVRNDDNSEFGTFTTARAAVARRVTGATSARASLGIGFKAPTFFENFSTGFVRGNPNLTPERNTMFELGVVHGYGDRGSVGATVFRQRFRDLIQYNESAPDPEPSYVNLPAASANGLEIETAWRISSGLTSRASYTWLKTEVTDAGVTESSPLFVEGERLIRRPTHSGTLGLNYLAPGEVQLGLAATFIGERDDRDFSVFPAIPVVMEAFTRLDLSAVVPLGTGSGWFERPALVLRAENLLDETREQIHGFGTPRLTFFAGLRIGN